jgi:hypothetical protein
MLVKLKQLGLAVTVHKPAIAKEDLGKFYNSFNLNSPVGLQNKVFIGFSHRSCFGNCSKSSIKIEFSFAYSLKTFVAMRITFFVLEESLLKLKQLGLAVTVHKSPIAKEDLIYYR